MSDVRKLDMTATQGETSAPDMLSNSTNASVTQHLVGPDAGGSAFSVIGVHG
jgi:hypothetical protein